MFLPFHMVLMFIFLKSFMGDLTVVTYSFFKQHNCEVCADASQKHAFIIFL